MKEPGVGRRSKRNRRGPSRISRRLVLFLHGYDPRGAAGYHRLFERDLARFASLWGVEAEVTGAPVPAEMDVAAWEARVQLADGAVHCRYEYLGWDDIIAADMARSVRSRVAAGLRCGAALGLDGFFGRILAASRRYGLVCLWPFLCLLLFLLLGLTVLVATMLFARWLVAETPAVMLFAGLAGLLSGGALVALLLAATRGPPFHIPHALAVRTFAADYAAGRRADVQARVRRFAEHLGRRLAEGDNDEVLLVGHSAGGYLVVELLARALEREPALLRRAPRLCLVTLGGGLPLVALHREAGWYRSLLCRVAEAPGLLWVDFRARWDWMSFHGYDLRRLTGGKAGPRVRNIQARQVLAPERLRSLRLRLFHRHMHYLRASERRGHYDYFSLVCGSEPLARRLRASATEMAPWGAGEQKPAAAALDPASVLLHRAGRSACRDRERGGAGAPAETAAAPATVSGEPPPR